MPSYKLTGQIKVIDFTQTFDSGFTKREFVVTTEEKFPQDIKFELTKEKCDMIDQYNVGDWLEVDFNMRGNEYKGKYYVNLVAWKLATAEGHESPQEAEAKGDEARSKAKVDTAKASSEEDDNLPF